MRLTLAALALLASIATASAGWNCQTYGNQTHCTSSDGQTYNCQRYGNQTHCQ